MGPRGHSMIIAGIVALALAIGGGAYAGFHAAGDAGAAAPQTSPGTTSFAASDRLDAIEASLRDQLQTPPAAAAPVTITQSVPRPAASNDDRDDDDHDEDDHDESEGEDD